MRVNRRGFGKLAAMFAAGNVMPLTAQSSKMESLSFPKGFVWGTATAAYQVEGAVHEDGRGLSIWDTMSHMANKIHNGETGDVADDSYHRYPEDIALMKALGVNAYRFSIAWPRIFPDGTGQPNQKGIDHYRKLTEALLAAGIEPYCTLYHWDLPQALEDKGGWQSKATAEAFGAYSGYTVAKLSDLIKNWMTINEMSSVLSGYNGGHDAPQLKLDKHGVAQVKHHLVLAHGLAVQAIRASAPKVRVGSAESAKAITPVFDAPEHVTAARKAMVEENAAFLTVMHTGKYTDRYLKLLGADAPVFTEEELSIISTPTDFQGLNIYLAEPVKAADGPDGYEYVPIPRSYPRMASPWLTIGPESLYWIPKLAAETLGIKEIYITENGCSAADAFSADGQVYDTDRVMFLSAYLTQLQRAVSEGVPVKGYFLWSLLDNFEWSTGYSQRFGITYVDFATQKRTPKLSSKFFSNVIARGKV